MNEVTGQLVKVTGASIYRATRGSGPVVLIMGGGPSTPTTPGWSSPEARAAGTTIPISAPGDWPGSSERPCWNCPAITPG
jgi:hypothetical protein